MDSDLDAVTAALAELKEAELDALVEAANQLVLIAAGLLSWVEHLADWEISRRAGISEPLHAPESAIPPEEGENSIAAAIMLRDQFAENASDEGANFAALFDAVVGAIGGPPSPA